MALLRALGREVSDIHNERLRDVLETIVQLLPG
jgi:hypothetical protein